MKLSDAQNEIFDNWKRPLEDTREQDNMLMLASNEIDLVQDITTDCSVVASLCAAIAREAKGHETVRLAQSAVLLSDAYGEAVRFCYISLQFAPATS